jgi:hypothetical protein
MENDSKPHHMSLGTTRTDIQNLGPDGKRCLTRQAHLCWRSLAQTQCGLCDQAKLDHDSFIIIFTVGDHATVKQLNETDQYRSTRITDLDGTTHTLTHMNGLVTFEETSTH